jgi:ABC-type phosphate transport system ATPase subunit
MPFNYIKKYIFNSFAYIYHKKNLQAIDILNELIEYENNISDTKSYTSNNINNNNNVYDLIKSIDINYDKRKKLYEFSLINKKKFEKICDDFNDITSKKFTVEPLFNQYEILDYEYFIVNKDKNYKCSLGEYELINFLFDFHNNQSQIIIIDEPCTHLSSQNKLKLKNIFNNKKKHKTINIYNT